MRYFVIIILVSVAILPGCYYDDKDLLDPNRSICDTSIITYSGTISPILTAYCAGCHTGPNAPLGIRVDSYNATKTLASNGKLLGSIAHSSGFIPMPKNGTKLSDCNIAKIRKWITAGTPNN